VFFFFLQKVNKKSSSHPRSTDILYNKQTIKMTTTTTKRTYSNPLVRIGNWREDEALELVGGVFYLVSSRHRALVFIGSARGIPFSHFFKNPSLSLSLSATASSSSSRDDSHDPRSLYLSLYLCLSLSRRNWRRTSRRRKMALDTWTFCSKDERDVCERFCPCPPKAQHPRFQKGVIAFLLPRRKRMVLNSGR